MKCPSCEKNVELTWSRYLTNPFSRFVCPGCSAKFKFVRPLIWYIWYVVWLLSYLGGMVFLIQAFNFSYMWVIFWVVTIAMTIIYASIDRKIESSFETKLR